MHPPPSRSSTRLAGESDLGVAGGVLAVVDFDGTLVRKGSLVKFVRSLAGWRTSMGAAGRGALAVIRHRDRRRFKTVALAHVLRGRASADVDHTGRRLATHLLRSATHPTMVDQVYRHLDQGHTVMIVSSALDVYVAPAATALGIEATITPRVEVVDGRCTGTVLDATMTGPAKVEAVRGWIREESPVASPVVFAYGDSRGDRELLEWAAGTRRQLDTP